MLFILVEVNRWSKEFCCLHHDEKWEIHCRRRRRTSSRIFWPGFTTSQPRRNPV